jgi:hypothetical protein
MAGPGIPNEQPVARRNNNPFRDRTAREPEPFGTQNEGPMSEIEARHFSNDLIGHGQARYGPLQIASDAESRQKGRQTALMQISRHGRITNRAISKGMRGPDHFSSTSSSATDRPDMAPCRWHATRKVVQESSNSANRAASTETQDNMNDNEVTRETVSRSDQNSGPKIFGSQKEEGISRGFLRRNGRKFSMNIAERVELPDGYVGLLLTI